MILQITPVFPSATNGVFDYAQSLRTHGLFPNTNHSTICVAPSALPFDSQSETTTVSRSSKELYNALCELNPISILFHFTGYGYHKRALCYWIVDTLTKWKSLNPRCNIVTLFHEVYALSSPWTTAFWLTPFQKHIATKLALLSDHLLVTSDGGYNQIQSLNISLPCTVLPVFSSMGEPSILIPFDDRGDYAVIFGGTQTRSSCYNLQVGDQYLLKLIFKKVGINHLFDIGPPSVTPSHIGGIPVTCLGLLSSLDISSKLSMARLGLIKYGHDHILKSSVAAAYSAHGCIPLNLTKYSSDTFIHHRQAIAISLHESMSDELNWPKLTQDVFNAYHTRSIPATIDFLQTVLL